MPGLSWVVTRSAHLLTPLAEASEFIQRPSLAGCSQVHCSDGLHNTLLSPACIPEGSSTVTRAYIPGTGQSGEEPPIAEVQLLGHLAVTSSPWPPSIIPLSVCQGGSLSHSLCKTWIPRGFISHSCISLSKSRGETTTVPSRTGC